MISTPSPQSNEHHIYTIVDCKGYNGMRDLVTLHINHPAKPVVFSKFVLYFPGDIQLTRKEMNSGNEEHRQWVHECFENTIMNSLAPKYSDPNTIICIIGPTSHCDVLNEFDHFYEAGCATFHLLALIDSVKQFVLETFGSLKVQFDSYIRYELIAFSKGCVALNTILSEIASAHLFRSLGKRELLFWDTPEGQMRVQPCYHIHLKNLNHTNVTNFFAHSDQILMFSRQIDRIHWLDCHRYINNARVNRLLSELFHQYQVIQQQQEQSEEEAQDDKLFFFIHSTPFIDQSGIYRRHIRPEYDQFYDQCKSIAKKQLYLQRIKPTLQTHFDILRVFQPLT